MLASCPHIRLQFSRTALWSIVQIDHPLGDSHNIDQITVYPGDVPRPQRMRLYHRIFVLIRQDKDAFHVGHQVAEREDSRDFRLGDSEKNGDFNI